MCETLVQFNLYIVLNSNIELFSTMKVLFNAAQAPVTWLSAAGSAVHMAIGFTEVQQVDRSLQLRLPVIRLVQANVHLHRWRAVYHVDPCRRRFDAITC